MALPNTIAAELPFTSYFPKPIYGNGNTVTFWRDVVVSSDEFIEAWASANPATTSESEQDSANRPSMSSGDTLSNIGVKQIGSTIHIFTSQGFGSGSETNVTYLYHTFNTSTLVWGTTDTTIEASVDTDGIARCTAIDARSDGDIITFYQGSSDKIMGVDYTRCDKNEDTGSGFAGPVAIDDGGETSYVALDMCVDDSDASLFLYAVGSDLYYKSWADGGSLSSAQQVNDNAIGSTTHAQIKTVNNGTNDYACVVWKRDSTSRLVSSIITNRGTPSAETEVHTSAISDSSTIVGIGLVGENNGDGTSAFYVTYILSSDSDVYYEKHDLSSWSGSPTAIYSSITADNIAPPNIYTNDDSDKVLAWIGENSGSTYYYNEYVLSSGGTTLSPAAAILGLVASNPDLALAESPATASLSLNASNPTIALGAYTPAAAILNLDASVGSVSQGIYVSPAAAILNLLASNPSLALGISAEAILNLLASNPSLLLGGYSPQAAILNLLASDSTFNISLAGGDAILNLDASLGNVYQAIVPSAAILNLLAANPSLALSLAGDNAILNLLATNPSLAITLAGGDAILNLLASVGSVSVGGDVTLSPAAAILNLLAANPSLSIALTGANASINLEASNPSLASATSPNEANLSLQASINSASLALTVATASLALQANNPTLALSIFSQAATVALEANNPTLALVILGNAASVGLQASVGTVSASGDVTLSPAAAILGLEASSPILGLAIAPSGAILSLQADGTIAVSTGSNAAILNLLASNPSLAVALLPGTASLSLQASNGTQPVTLIANAAILNLLASVGAVDVSTLTDAHIIALMANKKSLTFSADKDSLTLEANKKSLTFTANHDT